MTLPYSPSIACFKGNGVVQEFPFNFKVWDSSQLVVSVAGPDGIVENINFSAQLTENGGTVTALYNNAPVPQGYTLSIVRNMPFEQGVDLVSGTRFDPQVIEDQLDKAAAERQQLREAVGRAVIIPAASNDTQQELLNKIFAAQETSISKAQAASNSAGQAAQSSSAAHASEQAAALSAAGAEESARIAQDALEHGSPTATDTNKGVVYLSDAIDSIRGVGEGTAATPLAVQKACDFALDMQWKAEVEYKKPCTRLGSNGRLYLWRAPSGPSVAGVGAKDPVTEEGKDYWLDNKKDSGFIGGGIIPFSGAFGGPDNRHPIPRGETEADCSYVLCDGGSDGMGGSVPDLRGRFVIGAGEGFAARDIGGAAEHSHSMGGNTGSTTLSAAQMPSHSHGYNQGGSQYRVPYGYDNPTAAFTAHAWVSTGGAGSSGAHSHTLVAQSAVGGTLPPYYALAYIMKL